MHFLPLSLPFGSACNFLVSPFFYRVCTSMLVRYDSELIVRVILNDHFTKKRRIFSFFFLRCIPKHSSKRISSRANRKTMGIGRKFPRVKEGKLHPSYVLIEIRLKLRILHVKWYLKIIGGSWPGTTFFPLFTGPCPTRSKVWRVVSR